MNYSIHNIDLDDTLVIYQGGIPYRENIKTKEDAISISYRLFLEKKIIKSRLEFFIRRILESKAISVSIGLLGINYYIYQNTPPSSNQDLNQHRCGNVKIDYKEVSILGNIFYLYYFKDDQNQLGPMFLFEFSTILFLNFLVNTKFISEEEAKNLYSKIDHKKIKTFTKLN